MDPYVDYKRYFDLAKSADCATWRTVYLLGLMCATAVNEGGFVAFVGRNGGANWPDAREAGDRTTVNPPVKYFVLAKRDSPARDGCNPAERQATMLIRLLRQAITRR